MNMHLKEIGGLAKPRRWTGFAWTVALFVLVLAIGTAVVGVKLYEVTDREVGYNTR